MTDLIYALVHKSWYLLLAAGLIAADMYLLALLTSTMHVEKVHLPLYTDDIKPTSAALSREVNSLANTMVDAGHAVTTTTGNVIHTTASAIADTIHTEAVVTAASTGMTVPMASVNTANTAAAAPMRDVVETEASSRQPVRPHVTRPATVVAAATTPVAQPASPAPPDTTAAWPINGRVTTQFNVPDLPFQTHHTGLDISSGHPSGVTPIKAFKAGRVTEVIHSSTGLGNHVVVDHGSGLTSVYGHMYSVAVQVGQRVDHATTLGYEGSTGASTGTHLHFEIRQNGQPVNPRNYISGGPESS